MAHGNVRLYIQKSHKIRVAHGNVSRRHKGGTQEVHKRHTGGTQEVHKGTQEAHRRDTRGTQCKKLVWHMVI